ncbi:MAG: tetratricopeptide repeat protein, partial [Chthoniobacterales bacterium]
MQPTSRTSDEPAQSKARHSFRWYLQRTWLRVAALTVAGFVAHYPSLHGELIWDDLYLARENPFIKSPLLALETFRHYLLIDSFSAHYRPVQTISYMFDYFFWNTNTFGFHLQNVLWHLASGILLYFLLCRLLRGLLPRADMRPKDLAFAAAIIWILHPVHSAAVDYISGRADSLAFAFAAGGWLLFLKGRELARLSRHACHGVAVLCALLALCSRESACIWLLLFLLWLLLFDRAAGARQKAIFVIVCLAIFSGYVGLRHLPQDRSVPLSSGSTALPIRAMLMLRALGDYGRLIVFPSNLHMERTVEEMRGSISQVAWRNTIGTEYLSALGLIVAAALVLGSCKRGLGQCLRIAGAGWFIVAYLPISNLIELNATVAEHWLYLPSVGFILFVVGCAMDLPLRVRPYARALCCLAIAGLATRTIMRSSDWTTEERFYRRTITAGGTSVRVALNLGQIYAARGEYAKAEGLFRKVLEISPDYPIARTNLASVLLKLHKKEESEAIYAASAKAAEQTRFEYPRTWLAALNLAHIHFVEHDLTGAISILDRARADYPGTWQLISLESEALREANGPEAALPLVQEFARTHWWHAGAAIALGKLLSEAAKTEDAEAAFRQASHLDVHGVEALNLLALIDVQHSRFDSAFMIQRRAIARQPEEPRQ